MTNYSLFTDQNESCESNFEKIFTPVYFLFFIFFYFFYPNIEMLSHLKMWCGLKVSNDFNKNSDLRMISNVVITWHFPVKGLLSAKILKLRTIFPLKPFSSQFLCRKCFSLKESVFLYFNKAFTLDILFRILY